MASNRRSINLKEAANCAQFSPYQNSCALLAVGGSSKITISEISLQEASVQQGNSLLQALEFEQLFEVLYGDMAGVSCISWSPASYCDGEDRRIQFCATGSDRKIKLYTYNLHNTTCETLMKGTYVNDLACHPTDPTLMASVGDDKLCRIWDLNAGSVRSEFKLGSPGMSVRWHQQDPMKLMVAEKCGRVRFYDVTTDLPIMTLDAHTPPLMAVDWASSDSLRVGGVAANNWCIWDVSKSSQPLECKPAHTGMAVDFKWCKQNSNIFATVGITSQLKVHHLRHQKVPIACDLQVASDLSWHVRLPVLAVASDRKLHLWSVET